MLAADHRTSLADMVGLSGRQNNPMAAVSCPNHVRPTQLQACTRCEALCCSPLAPVAAEAAGTWYQLVHTGKMHTASRRTCGTGCWTAGRTLLASHQLLWCSLLWHMHQHTQQLACMRTACRCSPAEQGIGLPAVRPWRAASWQRLSRLASHSRKVCLVQVAIAAHVCHSLQTCWAVHITRRHLKACGDTITEWQQVLTCSRLGCHIT